MVDLTTGVIRAGGPPCVAPWCRVRGDKSGGVYRATVGAIASHWLIDLTGLRSSVAGVAGVDAAPRTAGRFFAAGAAPTVRAAMDELMGSIWGGVWYEGALGVATVGRLPLVGGAVKAAYRERVNCDPIMPDSYSQDAAAKRIEWRYARNYNPAASPSQAATSEQVLRAITEWLVEPHDNGAVAAAWGNAARTVTVDSLLYNSADAAAEAALAAADLAYPWRVWRAPVWGGAAGVDIGDEILVYSDQPGFENGGRLIVIGRSLSNRAGRAILIGITR